MTAKEMDEIAERAARKVMKEHPCRYSEGEAGKLHKVAANGHIDRLVKVSDAVDESGADRASLTGLFAFGVSGKRFVSRLTLLVFGGFLFFCFVLGAFAIGRMDIIKHLLAD